MWRQTILRDGDGLNDCTAEGGCWALIVHLDVLLV